MATLARILSLLAAGASLLLVVRVRSVAGLVLWMPKALAGSAAPFLAAIGALGAALGWLSRARLASVASGLALFLSVRYVRRVTASHDGFAQAFGPDWRGHMASEQQARLLQHRWVGRLPPQPGAHWRRNVPFWTMPGTGRQLLCDIWQPPEGVRRSGLAFVYLHGGAWHWADKDFNTRPFFRHLASQGHVVMDVAYRLCPEVDIYGMIGDVKRAIVWMKASAAQYGVDPARVVVAGGSAGGHLALLAAYTPDHPELTPDDVQDADRSVQAVVAYYAPADLRAVYQRFDSTFGSLGKGPQPRIPNVLFRVTGAVSGWLMGSASGQGEDPDLSFAKEIERTGLFPWLMMNLLGGSPEEVPDAYEMASPITHAGPASPPTLLLQGAHDAFVPAHVTRALHGKLTELSVPSIYVEFPQTEHAFDLFLPRYAPAAQAALYDVERFLALMA